MNRIFRILFLVSVFTAIGISGYSQDVDSVRISNFRGFQTPKFPTAQNVFKFNIIPVFLGQIPLCGELRLTYERMIAYNHSLTLGASYNFPNLLLFVMPAAINPKQATLSKYSMRGARFIFGYRYYPLKAAAPKGFFFGPYFSYNFVKIQERHGNGSFAIINYANASLICGYQAKLSKHLFFEFFGGLGYKRNFEVDYDAFTKQKSTGDLYNEKIPYFRNVKFCLQVNMGYGF